MEKTLNHTFAKQAEQERQYFLSLCDRKDRQLINGEETLNVRHFERILYILEALGLETFSASFSLNHEDLLCELAELIEQDLDRQEKPDTFVMLDTVGGWLSDFCNGISDTTIRNELKIRFDLDTERD